MKTCIVAYPKHIPNNKAKKKKNPDEVNINHTFAFKVFEELVSWCLLDF